MTNTTFVVHKKSGVNHITFTPSHKSEQSHFGVIDGALVLGFMVAFVGMVILLVR